MILNQVWNANPFKTLSFKQTSGSEACAWVCIKKRFTLEALQLIPIRWRREILKIIRKIACFESGSASNLHPIAQSTSSEALSLSHEIAIWIEKVDSLLLIDISTRVSNIRSVARCNKKKFRSQIKFPSSHMLESAAGYVWFRHLTSTLSVSHHF